MKNDSSEFDKIAANYRDERVKDLDKFGKYGDTAFLYKTRLLKSLLKNEPKSILDFGCGIGLNIPFLHDCFKNTKLFGCDISPESIEIARKNYAYCDFCVVGSINDLQIYKNIDCIFISTVLHHIPPKEHKHWIDGLYNILSNSANITKQGGGGIMIVFEHNMNNPITRSIVKKSKIDEDATMLSPKYCKRLLLNKFYLTKTDEKEIKLASDNVKLKYTYFFPWRNKLFTIIERLLYWFPMGAQYCIYGTKNIL
jgi:SAM-dependent methyltransferase